MFVSYGPLVWAPVLVFPTSNYMHLRSTNDSSGLMLAIYGGMTVPKPMRDQIWDIYQVNMRPL